MKINTLGKGFIVLMLAFVIGCRTPPQPPAPIPEPEPIPPNPPELTLSEMRVEKINNSMVELFVYVYISNPNEIELPAPRLYFNFESYRTSLVRSRLRNPEKLPPNSSTPIIFGILVYYEDLYRLLPEVIREREIPSNLHMICDINLPISGEQRVTFQTPFTLPIQW